MKNALQIATMLTALSLAAAAIMIFPVGQPDRYAATGLTRAPQVTASPIMDSLRPWHQPDRQVLSR